MAPMVALIAFAAVGAAWAQPSSLSDVVAARPPHFKQQGQAFKAILDQLHGGSPDPAVIKANANTLAALAEALPSWFPAGSGQDSGAKTRASSLIWSDAAGFAAASKAFQAQVGKLQAAADTGDLGAVAAAAQATGAACAACHNKYRAKED